MTRAIVIRLLAGVAAAWATISACTPAGEQAPPPEPQPLHPGLADPLLDQVAPAGLGGALQIANVALSGQFSEDGHNGDVGPPLVEGQVFGSHKLAGDAGVGSVSFTVSIPAGVDAIAIPVLTGPASVQSTFRVTAMPDGAPVAELKDAPGLATWRLWRVSVPQGADTVRVEATDTGEGWGQWVGVGAPYAVARP